MQFKSQVRATKVGLAEVEVTDEGWTGVGAT
jgi:hypothetical protein